jgi:uncharacterized protein (TIGR03435 family)
MTRTTILLVPIAVFALSPPLFRPLAFESASVRPNRSGERQVRIEISRGSRFVASNAPLRALLQETYQLQGDQFEGGPAWLDSDRFDIVAKAAEGASVWQVRVMLKALLTERFNLAMHSTMRDGWPPVQVFIIDHAELPRPN